MSDEKIIEAIKNNNIDFIIDNLDKIDSNSIYLYYEYMKSEEMKNIFWVISKFPIQKMNEACVFLNTTHHISKKVLDYEIRLVAFLLIKYTIPIQDYGYQLRRKKFPFERIINCISLYKCKFCAKFALSYYNYFKMEIEPLFEIITSANLVYETIKNNNKCTDCLLLGYVVKKNIELQNSKIEELQSEIEELKLQIKYMPHSTEYSKAEESFNSLKYLK